MIVNDSCVYLVISLLLIAFLPHFYLLLIFAIMTIVELVDKLIKCIGRYIMQIAFLLTFCYVIFNLFTITFNEIHEQI
jgi:hypothetical protein